jgi:hypothetical protein
MRHSDRAVLRDGYIGISDPEFPDPPATLIRADPRPDDRPFDGALKTIVLLRN